MADFGKDRQRARDTRAEIAANRKRLRRDDRRGAIIFSSLVAAVVIAIVILGWTMP